MKKSKRITRIIYVITVLLLLGVGVGRWYPNVCRNVESPYRLEVIRMKNNGYGYKIYERKRILIFQPFVPAVAGKNSFRTEQDARKVGNLVLERIRSGADFSISKADLKRQGIPFQ